MNVKPKYVGKIKDGEVKIQAEKIKPEMITDKIMERLLKDLDLKK